MKKFPVSMAVMVALLALALPGLAVTPYTDTFDGANGTPPDATWTVTAGSPTHNGAGQLACTDPAKLQRTIGAGDFEMNLSWTSLWLGNGVESYENAFYQVDDPAGGTAQHFAIKMQEQPNSSAIFFYCRAWIDGEAYNPTYDFSSNKGALLGPSAPGYSYDLRVVYDDTAFTFDVYYAINGGAMTYLLTRTTPPAWVASTASRTELLGLQTSGDAAGLLDSYTLTVNVTEPWVVWEGGVDLNWNTAGNWSDNVKPGTADQVLFDGNVSMDTDMVLDANFQIQGLKLQNNPAANWEPLDAGAGVLTLQDDTDNAVFIEYDADGATGVVRLRDYIVFNDNLTVKSINGATGDGRLFFVGSSLTGNSGSGVTFSSDDGITFQNTPTSWAGTTILEKGTLRLDDGGLGDAIIGSSGLEVSTATTGDAMISWTLPVVVGGANDSSDNDFVLGTAGDSTFTITARTTADVLTLQGNFTGGAINRNLNFDTADLNSIVLDTTVDINVDSKLQFLAGDGDVTLNGTLTKADGGVLIQSGHDLDGTGTIKFTLVSATTTGPSNFGDLPIDLQGGLDISAMTADFTGSTVDGASDYPLIAIDGAATLTGTFASETALPAGYEIQYTATEVKLVPLPPAPVMVVKGNGNTIASGDPASVANDTDFGLRALNDSVTHTFTIENTGDAELVLSGSPKVAVSGDDEALFVVTSLPTLPETPVASGGGTTTFDVEFTATGAEGAKTANLTIENNAGPDYTIPLAGAVNSTPTDIALAPSTLAENSVAGTEIGTLTTTDADGTDTFTYMLVTGNGTDDADNGLVAIAGDKVNVAGLIDYETNPTLAIRVQTEDPAGATFEKALTIAVTDETETFMMVAVGDVAVDDDVVGTVLAEGDSTSVSYDVTGGFHQSLFTIPVPASGELKLATPAAEGDLGKTYYVEVTATGSSPSASATMRIKVTVVAAGTSTGTIFVFK